jgi:toxin-antitoxin system PIN domain toxin
VLLPDASVLLYAHREDTSLHSTCLKWLEHLINGAEAFGLSELVLGNFLRIATHPEIFKTPTPLADAMAFVEQLRDRPNHVLIAPGRRHWSIFQSLCQSANAKGSLVLDAYLAAMAVESGCEWVTTDRDFSRFPGLRWRHPA